jgi:Domain of unknown function (DUF3291)
MSFELAQVNIARLLAPLTTPQLKDFVDALDPVNALADAAPGFRWRLQTEDGDATAIRAFEWDAGTSPGIIVNMSVWGSVEELAAFTFSGAHREVLRRRREWFERMREAVTALWWVPEGHRPSTDEAEERIRHLRAHGPTPHAFTLKQTFAPAADTPEPGRPGWLCPA